MARKAPISVPKETPIIGVWRRVPIRCKEVGEERRVWAMVFKCGGVEFGLFQANFNIPAVPDKSFPTQYNGIIYGKWSTMHIESGRLICHNCQSTPDEALKFFKHFRISNFGKGKKNKIRFAEAVQAMHEKLTREGR